MLYPPSLQHNLGVATSHIILSPDYLVSRLRIKLQGYSRADPITALNCHKRPTLHEPQSQNFPIKQFISTFPYPSTS